MARAQSTDFLHSMRFHVVATRAATSGTGDNPLTNAQSPSAGFMSVTTPEATTEAVEYREGTYNFPRKFPGNTTVSDLTFQKGVARGDGTFWTWLKQVVFGTTAGTEYRCDLSIFHMDRRALRGNMPGYTIKDDKIFSETDAARVYYVYDAFPIRHKVAADLDASTSDVSVMELDVAYESFDIHENSLSSTTGAVLKASG